MGLPQGVRIVGDLPNRGDRPQLLMLYANTSTERKLLQKYADQRLAEFSDERRPAISWLSVRDGEDHMSHEGLMEGLSKHESMDIVPIGIAWTPKDSERQSWRKIRRWMKLIDSDRAQSKMLRRSPQRSAIIVGEFGTRKALRAKYERQTEGLDLPSANDPKALANYIALQAAITIGRDSRLATGQQIKYPRFVKRSIWGRPTFQAELIRLSKEQGKPLEEIQQTARDALKELVPRVHASHVALSGAFSRNVCRLGYDEKVIYDQEKMEKIREMALTRPVALVWTHKTHIDGMAMVMATQEENFPLVHNVGGNNMAFLGIGYLMSRAGTIFIRRKIDCDVYKAVMQEYIAWLLEKRFPISWALEGTRSRNGKLMPPRFGILKYVVEAAAKKNMTDLTVVPVSIYYDLIAELGDYAREQTGETKRKESLAWFTGYVRSLRKPLGRISMGLGDPVVVDTTSKQFNEIIHADDNSFSVELQKIAFEASVKANAVTPLTPSSLVALVLSGSAPRALTRKELADGFWALRNWAVERNLPMTDELQKFDRERVYEIVLAMIEIGVVSRYEGGREGVYSIADGKHFEASYYRNNSIHHFVNKALIEVALAHVAADPRMAPVDAFFEEALRLRDTFKYEFFYPDTETYKAELDAELTRYDPSWKARLAAQDASVLLSEMTPHVSHAVLRPFTEAYSVVADILHDKEPGQAIEEKPIVQEALTLGRQAFLQRRITSEESIGKLMFSNGYKLAENRGLIPADETDIKAARWAFIQELDDVARRLREIGVMSERRRGAAAAAITAPRLSVVGDS